MPASLPRVTGTPITWKKMGLLVTTIEEIATNVATIEVDVEGKENLPVGEVNSPTRVGPMNMETTQCGHTVGTLTLPVVALPRIVQRSTPAAREWVVA